MVSTSLVVLLLAGVSVAILHSILPDHWMPIAVVARAQRWSTGRTMRVALWTGVGHVLGSFTLGVIVLALGYGLKGILRLEGPIVGIVLVLTGVGLFLWSLRRPGHHHPHPHGAEADPPCEHDHHDHRHSHHHHDNPRSRGVWLIPAGIAASPDPTILPVFLAAISVNIRTAIDVLMVYALVTIVVIVGLSLAALWSGYQVKSQWLERHANHVTAVVLVALGLTAWAAF